MAMTCCFFVVQLYFKHIKILIIISLMSKLQGLSWCPSPKRYEPQIRAVLVRWDCPCSFFVPSLFLPPSTVRGMRWWRRKRWRNSNKEGPAPLPSGPFRWLQSESSLSFCRRSFQLVERLILWSKTGLDFLCIKVGMLVHPWEWLGKCCLMHRLGLWWDSIAESHG